jgi:hypothetical protein
VNLRIDMLGRWKAGQSLHEIGRAFGKDHVSIQFMLSQHGGIAPATRRRSLLTLTLAERENISQGIACSSSIRVQQRYGYGGRRPEPTRSSTARVAPAFVELGSRAGNGPAQEFHGRYESESALL